ncbi:MAG: hypothetical protein KTR30_17745 [Saprospiraceae bacterium]|nr:hypothetical protein [Saprospiraceae bacterium]
MLPLPSQSSSSSDQPIVYHKTKFSESSRLFILTDNPKKLFPLLLGTIASFIVPAQFIEGPLNSAHIYMLQSIPLLLFTLLLWMVYRNFKKKQIELVEELRIKLSADLHDEVGSVLSGLAMQAEILECTVAEPQRDRVRKLAEMSRQAMAQMRDTVWAMDARKDNWGGLVDRLHDHAAELLEPRQIAFAIEIEGINRQKSLKAELRQHLYLIGKEAITNAAKHSNGDQLQIHLRQDGDLLEMFIQDNGQFDQEEELSRSGLGLSNIALRAKALGASLNIQRQNGFGISLCLMANS